MVDVKGKCVYLSGPMTGVKNNNAGAFADAHAALKLMGAEEVYDPALQWLQSECDREHSNWMRYNLRELSIGGDRPYYDILVSLPGAENSHGAMAERIVARACGVMVVELSEVLGDD